MAKVTKIVNYINENGYELKELDYGWYSTHENDDSVYLEFYIQKLNLEVIIEKVSYNYKVGIFRNKNGKTYEVGGIVCRTQNDIIKVLKEIIGQEEQLQNEIVPCGTIEESQETSYNHGKDSMDENCMNNKSSMLMAINNKDSQESICDFVPCGKDSVDTQSVSRSEYCEKLKPFTNYVQDMARHHRHDYNELIKTEYNTTKKALELFTVGEFAFIPNTLDGKKEYLKGMLDTTKKDIKNLVLNNDEGDYEALELFYRLHAQLESTKGLLNELCGFKNEMILR